MVGLSDKMLSDETLMSYADGMLDPVERARVAAAVAADADAARRLTAFQRTGEPLNEVYRSVAEAPVPRHLDELVRNFPVMKDRAASRVVDAERPGLIEALKQLFRPRSNGLAGSLAYALTFLAGAGAMWFAVGRIPQESASTILIATADGRVGASGQLAVALERSRSIAPGVPSVGRDPGPVELVQTFKSDRGYCRQYTVAATSSSMFSGIACREGDGRWIVQAQFPAIPRKSAAVGNVLAGEAVEIRLLVETMNTAAALSRDDEAVRIARGWRD